jgi:hypothetical protein
MIFPSFEFNTHPLARFKSAQPPVTKASQLEQLTLLLAAPSVSVALSTQNDVLVGRAKNPVLYSI